jgi:SAM-dependent methyltransferase
MAFDPRSYWEERLGERLELDTVGFKGLGLPFNSWMYRVRRHVFRKYVRPLVRAAPGLEVLDVGSGSGFYLERWAEAGAAAVVGSDLTSAAVGELRRRFPQHEVIELDIGADPSELPERRFGAASAFDVLFHVVDDERFERAIGNLYELLEPGGLLVISDNFVHGEAERAEHHVSRPLRAFEAALEGAGFDVLLRRPMFFLMNEPVDSRSRLHRAFWNRLARVLRRRKWRGGVIGATLYPFELAFLALLREGPSTELMICRKPPATAPG